MASSALDLITMGQALNVLQQEHLGPCSWSTINDEQMQFNDWYAKFSDQIAELRGLAALASLDYQVLNKFLVEHGFEPKFDEFDGVGVASLLDMLVEWFVEAAQAIVFSHCDEELMKYPAFSLDAGGVEIFDPEFGAGPLARIKTKSGDSLWLQMEPAPTDGLHLALVAQAVAQSSKRINTRWTAGVVVPKVEIITEPDLSWMLGFNTRSERDGYHSICQAFQMFRFRMNEEGARAKVATGFATTRGVSRDPQPLVFDRPFMGYSTQAGYDDLPLAAFYADKDSWFEPTGSLTDL
jgi:hypothetical protein